FGRPFSAASFEFTGVLHSIAPWFPAVLTALVFVWAGRGSSGLRLLARAAAAAVSLLILWLAPAVIAAATAAVGSRVYLGHPAEMLGLAQGAFLRELGPDGGGPMLISAAIILAALGLVVKSLLRRHPRW